MPCPVTILTKVIGTVSLGILAGAATSNSIVSLSDILLGTRSSSCSTEDIQDDPQHTNLLLKLYQTTFTKVIVPLSSIAFTSLLSAYLIAPAKGRHPYLIYSSLSIPILYGLNYLYGPGIEFSGCCSKFNIGSICSKVVKSKSDIPSTEAATISSSIHPSTSPTTSTTTTTTTSSKQSSTPIDEPSLLDNSVYAHLETPNTTANSSDNEFSSVSSNTPTPEEQSEDEQPTISSPTTTTTTTTSSTTITTSQLKSNLNKLNYYSTIIVNLAFLITTIGIYGDLS